MPISDCDVRDPRMRRTRQLLQGALRTLMQTKGFDEISVQDIAEAATVNRATFYDHYTDKYALLDAMVAGGFHMLLHERNVVYDGTCPSAITALILATCDYLIQSYASPDCSRQSAFAPLVDAAITRAIRSVLMHGLKKETDVVQDPMSESCATCPPEMIATAASWALYGAVKEWFYVPNHPAVEVIVPEIQKLVLPMLESARLSAAGV